MPLPPPPCPPIAWPAATPPTPAAVGSLPTATSATIDVWIQTGTCPVLDVYGVPTGNIRVASRRLRVPASWLIGDPICVENPECCDLTVSPSTVVTECCPDDPVPAALTLTVSGVGGGSFTTNYLAGQWETGVLALTGAGAGSFDVNMYCFGNVWQLNSNNSNGIQDYDISFSNYVTTCSPFSVQADGLLSGLGSYDGETRVFTVTP